MGSMSDAENPVCPVSFKQRGELRHQLRVAFEQAPPDCGRLGDRSAEQFAPQPSVVTREVVEKNFGERARGRHRVARRVVKDLPPSRKQRFRFTPDDREQQRRFGRKIVVDCADREAGARRNIFHRNLGVALPGKQSLGSLDDAALALLLLPVAKSDRPRSKDESIHYLSSRRSARVSTKLNRFIFGERCDR